MTNDDLEILIKHVGCGDLDVAGRCPTCEKIRAILESKKIAALGTNQPLSPEFWLGNTKLEDLFLIHRNGRQWLGNIDIIPLYMPRHPRPDTKPMLVIRWAPADKPQEHVYLRYSQGPGQGFFWDIYGDDFLTVGFALLALTTAPPPPILGARAFRQEFSFPLAKEV